MRSIRSTVKRTKKSQKRKPFWSVNNTQFISTPNIIFNNIVIAVNASNVSSKYRKWYENGQIKSEEHYKDVMTRDGKWTEWDENGQIESEKNYKDGECISGDC